MPVISRSKSSTNTHYENGKLVSDLTGQPVLTPEQQIAQQAVSNQAAEAEATKRSQETGNKIASEYGSLYRSGLSTPYGLEARNAIKGIQGIDLSTDINRFRGIADTQGLSKQGQDLTAQQRAEEAAALQGLQQEQATQAASAYSNLAQQGGAGPGARERLGGQLGTQSLFASQAQRQQGEQARLGISAEDEARKLEAAKIASQLSQAQAQSGQAAQIQRAGLLNNLISQERAGQEAGLKFRQSVYGTEELARAQERYG